MNMIKIQQGEYRYRDHSIPIPDIFIKRGDIVGLNGVSGSGKSTIGKILTRQLNYDKHKLRLPALTRNRINPVQWVGQRCEFAFDPRWTIEKTLKEAYRGYDYRSLLESYELEFHWQFRLPKELSGGQLQRFNLVRALAPTTEFLICDEATDQLDSITQKVIWNALLSEVEQRSLGLLVITHQTELLQAICHRTVNMQNPNNAYYLVDHGTVSS
ncbi:ATP-binding cassette domain-containing protein [Vibrio atypicus]|uniref:ATP-binding cassette domain-containing protein n=1 Tax=Vibrio atypicus TaxID=558271 RepID=UPI001CECB030|nr:ATP-binding cassette domain-containing protein [Vibrio atypicus]